MSASPLPPEDRSPRALRYSFEELRRFRGERKEGLWGVYRFKKGFDGSAVRYVGKYDYVYALMRYQAWHKAVPWYAKLLSRSAA